MEHRQRTQIKRILEHLRRGQSITPIEALDLYGSFRLGAIIHKLRSEGINIESTLIHDGGKHYASYKLVPAETLFKNN